MAMELGEKEEEEMKTCTFIYKCRKCKEEYGDLTGGQDPARYALMSAVFELPFPKKFIGIPPSMHSTHFCKSGDFVGVTDLIGYHITE